MNNYFELYGLPETFHPDQAKVKAKYYELGRLYHPDRFAQSPTEKRLEALTLAALNNKAWKTLSDPAATMAYMLKQNGLLAEEEKYNLPPDFLMEMMDINEAISDYETEPENDAARQQVTNSLKEQLADWQAAAHALTTRFDNGEKDTELLLRIKDMYFRQKYLLRIQERIDKFAAR